MIKPDIFIQVTSEKNYRGLPSVIFRRNRGRVYIETLINRLGRVGFAGEIYLLFSDSDENSNALNWARKKRLNVIAGSESPFSRLHDGCRRASSEHIVRIPGEYLLINPTLTERMIRFHLENGADYTAAKGFPLGLLPPDIFSKSAIAKVGRVLTRPDEALSAASIFKKYAYLVKSQEFHAEGKLRREELGFALESEFDGKILGALHDPERNLLDPEETVGWLEEVKERAWERGRLEKYAFKKLTLSLTNRCNLRCRMCSIIQTSPELSLSEKCVNEVVDFAVNEKFEEIEISGGEPLLLKYVPEILSRAETGSTMVKLVTNGLLLDDSAMDMLKERDVTVQISVDGLGESHDFIRGKRGAYQKTMKIVQKLLYRKIKVGVHSVIQKSNVHQIYDLFRVFHEKPLQLYSLALVERMKDVHSEDLDQKDLSVLDCEFDRIIGFLREEGNDKAALRYDKLKKGYGRRSEEISFSMVQGTGCRVPYRSVIVNPDGSVVPCWHYRWNFPEEGFNVNNTHIYDIVHSRAYRERIFEVKRGKCSGCNTLCYGWDNEFSRNIFS